MQKKSICFYSISSHLGGAERSLMELVLAFKSNPGLGYDVWVLCPKQTGPLIDLCRQKNVDYSILEIPKLFLGLSRKHPWRSCFCFFLGFKKLTNYLTSFTALMNEKKPALIHSNGLKCHVVTGFLYNKLKRPVFWHIRDLLSSKLVSLLLKCFYKKNIRLIANSKATAAPFLKFRKPVTVFYNGLDFEKYKPNPASNPTPIVGILGALARWKGQIEFIKMAKKLVDLGVKVKFRIIGDEIYDTPSERGFKEEIRHEIIKLELGEKVELVGFKEDSVSALHELHVLVHASIKPEPFGRVVIEAMACGIPVVASQAGGILEIVDHGKTGLLFTPGDIDQMALLVKRILDEHDLRNQMIQNAFKKVQKDFNLDNQVIKMAELYNGAQKSQEGGT